MLLKPQKTKKIFSSAKMKTANENSVKIIRGTLWWALYLVDSCSHWNRLKTHVCLGAKGGIETLTRYNVFVAARRTILVAGAIMSMKFSIRVFPTRAQKSWMFSSQQQTTEKKDGEKKMQLGLETWLQLANFAISKEINPIKPLMGNKRRKFVSARDFIVDDRKVFM